jgi:hypothetical protein
LKFSIGNFATPGLAHASSCGWLEPALPPAERDHVAEVALRLQRGSFCIRAIHSIVVERYMRHIGLAPRQLASLRRDLFVTTLTLMRRRFIYLRIADALSVLSMAGVCGSEGASSLCSQRY